MMGSAKEMVCRALTSIHLLRPTHACAGRRRRWVEFDAERGKTATRRGEILFMIHPFDPPLTRFFQGETEKKTAQTADAADGLYNQVAGMVNKVAGQVMGDSTKEASGEFRSSLPLSLHIPASSIPPPLVFIRASLASPAYVLHSSADSRF
jgi:hypothetical protein